MFIGVGGVRYTSTFTINVFCTEYGSNVWFFFRVQYISLFIFRAAVLFYRRVHSDQTFVAAAVAAAVAAVVVANSFISNRIGIARSFSSCCS